MNHATRHIQGDKMANKAIKLLWSEMLNMEPGPLKDKARDHLQTMNSSYLSVRYFLYKGILPNLAEPAFDR